MTKIPDSKLGAMLLEGTKELPAAWRAGASIGDCRGDAGGIGCNSRAGSGQHTCRVAPTFQCLVHCLSIVCVFLGCTSGVSGQDLRAERVIGWDFQRGDDRNLDLQPDGWRRRRDRQHPVYIQAKIVSRDEAKSRRATEEQMLLAKLMHSIEVGSWQPNYVPEAIPPVLASIMDQFAFENCLEISMDGGAAEMVSSNFPVDPRFSYSLSTEASTEGLDGHRAWVELQLLDEQQQPIEILSTPDLTGTNAWQTLSTPVGAATSNQMRWGRVHLKVKPAEQMLISGIAKFDSIQIYRLPRLTLKTDLEYHLVEPGKPFVVTCQAMGISTHTKSVQFELKDHLQKSLKIESMSLQKITGTSLDVDRPDRPTESSLVGQHFVSTSSEPGVAKEEHGRKQKFYDGTAQWLLQLDRPGLYHVDVVLGSGGNSQRRELLIGVMPNYAPVTAGPFGWSIESFSETLSPEELPVLAGRFGAGWVKYPVWFDVFDEDGADALVAMTERLQALGIQCVGKIDQPPAIQREVFGEEQGHFLATTIFRDPKAWEPLLDPVLTRMGLKLNWFQLGSDGDTSFQSQKNLVDMLGDIRSRMQTYSQELKIALSWKWDTAVANNSANPWNALQYSASPQLTATELASYAKSLAEPQSAWVSLDPLPKHKYSILDRVRDLTERMIVVKQSAISAAFLNSPFDSDRGILEPNITVGEMLLPWTTLVAAIGDKQYIGSFAMPGGSLNHCFESEVDAVMVTWNDNLQTETLFLGNNIVAVDVWGAPVEVNTTNENGFEEQQLQVGPWPVVVHGIDPGIVRWRQQFQVTVANLASNIGDKKVLPIEAVNALPGSGNGTLSVVSESLLGQARASIPFQISQGGNASLSLPIQPRADASAGKHNLRFDVDINTGEQHRFSIYRQITLGTNDIEFRWEIGRLQNNLVEVRVELVNNTSSPTSFDCRFFPADQPYQRFLINEAKPGSTLQDIVLRVGPNDIENGAWIRCEEVGTGRVLNYRLKL